MPIKATQTSVLSNRNWTELRCSCHNDIVRINISDTKPIKLTNLEDPQINMVIVDLYRLSANSWK